MKKILLMVLFIGLFLIVACQIKSPSQEIIETRGGDWENWYCQGDLWYDEFDVLIADCKDLEGFANPSMYCRENTFISGLGTFGGYCVECVTSIECPVGYDCDSFDGDTPYMCVLHENGGGETCTDSDGSDYETRGTASTSSQTLQDDCAGSGELIEWICLNDEIDFEEISCFFEFGDDWICEDGKCIEEIEEPPACTDECSSNQKGCSATSVQRWYCGEDDSDNCLDIVYVSCGLQDKICENGECIEAVECTIDSECTEAPPCIGKEMRCILDKCSPVGECVDCIKNEDCDDNDPETLDECTDGKCKNTLIEEFDFMLLLWIGIPITILLIIIIILILTFRKKR